MYIGFYIKFLYYSNKFVNIVNLNIHILITYNHVKTHVCCVWRSFKIDYYYYIIINSINVTTARESKARWLQGIYFDWDLVFSKLRVLHEKLGLKSPHLPEQPDDFFK